MSMDLGRKEGSVLFNDAFNTFSYGYMASILGQTYGKGMGESNMNLLGFEIICVCVCDKRNIYYCIKYFYHKLI